MNLTLIHELWSYFWDWFWANPVTGALTALAVLRFGAVWAEGALVIWIPQRHDSRFWLFWARLMQTLDYISISIPRRPNAIRALNFWEQRRKALQQSQDETQAAIVPITKGGSLADEKQIKE